MPEVLTQGGDLDRVLVQQTGLDRPFHPELTQEIGHECSPDLTLLLERHSFGHVHCLLRFGAPLAEPSRVAGSPEPFLEPSTDAAPVPVALLRLRRRRAERLVPLPVPPVAVPALPEPFLAPAPAALGAGLDSPELLASPVDEPDAADEPTSLTGRTRRAALAALAAALTTLARATPPPLPLRRERSRRGRGPTGRTRARTLASTLTRPKSPVLGSSTTITSASPTATPS